MKKKKKKKSHTMKAPKKNSKITFPPLWKFQKNSLKIRGPTPLINYIRASKSPMELKNTLLQNFTERDRRRIYEKTKNQSQVFEWKLY